MSDVSAATEKRKAAEKRGQRAERLAAMALLFKGYRPVDRRYKTKSGEIDLIMRKGDLIIFVEVKARATHGAALDSVTATAKKRISKAATIWLSSQKDAPRLSWRFDIVTVVPRRWPKHHEHAW